MALACNLTSGAVPTDNDYGNNQPKREQIWKQSSKDFNVSEASVSMDGKNAVIKANYLLPAGNLYIVNYTIYPNGAVHVAAHFTSTEMKETETELSEATRTATFTPGRDEARKAASKLTVPRIGVRFRMPATMNQIAYFGRGHRKIMQTVNSEQWSACINQLLKICIIRMFVHRKMDTIQIQDGFLSTQPKEKV